MMDREPFEKIEAVCGAIIQILLTLGVIGIFILLAMLAWPKDACAGTTFTQLSKSVEIVDMDKWIKERDKAIEYARKQGAMVFTHSEVVE